MQKIVRCFARYSSQFLDPYPCTGTVFACSLHYYPPPHTHTHTDLLISYISVYRPISYFFHPLSTLRYKVLENWAIHASSAGSPSTDIRIRGLQKWISRATVAITLRWIMGVWLTVKTVGCIARGGCIRREVKSSKNDDGWEEMSQPAESSRTACTHEVWLLEIV